MSTSTPEERLERLERENARLRAMVFGGFLLTAVFVARAELLPRPLPPKISAREFVLEDEHGASRGEWKLLGDLAVLVMREPSDAVGATLEAGPKGNSLFLLSQGKPAVRLAAPQGKGPLLGLSDGEAGSLAMLGFLPGTGPVLQLDDRARPEPASLSLTPGHGLLGGGKKSSFSLGPDEEGRTSLWLGTKGGEAGAFLGWDKESLLLMLEDPSLTAGVTLELKGTTPSLELRRRHSDGRGRRFFVTTTDQGEFGMSLQGARRRLAFEAPTSPVP